MAVVLDPWATLPRQIDIQTMLEIMAGGFRYLKSEVTVTPPAAAGEDATATLGDHAVQALELGYARTSLTLPTVPSGRIGDIVVFVGNNYEEGNEAAEAAITFDGWGEDFELATFDGASISDILTFEGGARGVISLTMTPLSVEADSGGNTVYRPIWVIARHDIAVATAPAAAEGEETQEG